MSPLRVAENITELVGQTPMLHFRRIVPAGAADVFAKLQYLNPGGSVKDRAAIGMIKKAEEQGLLKRGCRAPSEKPKNLPQKSPDRLQPPSMKIQPILTFIKKPPGQKFWDRCR